MQIVTLPPDEELTPKSRRLLDKMYRSAGEEQVWDAAERLDTRLQAKQATQQNVRLQTANEKLQMHAEELHTKNIQLESQVVNLRSDLHSLIDKPANPEIAHLRLDVNKLTSQQTVMQSDLNATSERATSAHASTQRLTPQIQTLLTRLTGSENDIRTMQTSLNNAPEKEHVQSLEERINTLHNEKDKLRGTVRTVEQSVAKLKEAAGPDPAPNGGQIMGLMSRNDQSRGTALENSQIELNVLKTHVDSLSEAVVEVQEKLDIERNKPTSEPKDDRIRSALFGKWRQKDNRK